MKELRALLLLVERLVLALGAPDPESPPKVGILFDAGAHFFIRARVEGGPDFLVCYEVIYHSFGRSLGRVHMEKRITVQGESGAWEVGILEKVGDDPELQRLFAAEHMSAGLFRAMVHKGYSGRAVVFREDTWSAATIEARRGEALWESYGEGQTRYAFPIRSAEDGRDALRLVSAALEEGKVFVVAEAGERRLAYRAGAVAIVRD